MLLISSSILVVIAAICIYQLNNQKPSPSNNNIHGAWESVDVQQDLNEKFMQWYRLNGGWMHPHLRLQFDPRMGNGLIMKIPNENSNHDTTIEPHEIVLRIPDRMLLSRPRILELYPLLVGLEDHVFGRTNDNDSNDDAYWLALGLLLESIRHREQQVGSFWGPYLDVLQPPLSPSTAAPPITTSTPPLLFTFSESELDLLQDPGLAAMARAQMTETKHIWTRLDQGLRRLAAELSSQQKDDESSSSSMSFLSTVVTVSQRWTFDNFVHWYCLAQSHMMQLQQPHSHSQADTKATTSTSSIYLVPMADMINHAPRPSSLEITSPDEGDFGDFHQYVPAGSNGDGNETGGGILVRSDRRTTFSSSTTGSNNSNMLMEAYSSLDNSLYLAHFGFVPRNNPSHCSMIQFPPLNDASLQNALVQKFDQNEAAATTLCIRRDFSIADSSHPYMQLYRLVSLSHQKNGVDGGNEIMSKHVHACRDQLMRQPLSATNELNACNVASDSDRTSGDAWKRTLIQQAALMTLETYYPTSIEEDRRLFAKLSKSRERLAVEFRLADKELTHYLATTTTDIDSKTI